MPIPLQNVTTGTLAADTLPVHTDAGFSALIHILAKEEKAMKHQILF